MSQQIISKTMLKETTFAPKGIRLMECGLLICITIALVLKFHLILLLKIGWDEFLFLSQVFSYKQGTLTGQFQNFHVHLFSWLPHISDSEVNQIIAARSVLYLLFLGSCFFIYHIGKQFLTRASALFGVLCYVSLSNVILHAASFRTDSICSFLFLFSVFLLTTRFNSYFSTVISGLLLALSLMVSIKTLFHLLTVGCIFLCFLISSQNKKKVLKQLLCFSIAFLLGTSCLYGFHIYTIPLPELPEPELFIGRVSSKVIIFNDLFPRLGYFLLSLLKNPFIWCLYFLGIAFTALDLIRSEQRLKPSNLLLATFLIPMLTLLFYRNAFPYYYVFIIAPSIIFCGIVFGKIEEDFRTKGSAVFLILLTIISLPVFLNFIHHYSKSYSNENVDQKQLIQVVHEIFPEPVPYIDGCSAISTFPKVGLFMSTWGMESYLSANKPIMESILTNSSPAFIFANIPTLDLSLPRETAFSAINYALLEEDWDILKSNFIHHWANIFVAGKTFKFDEQMESQDFKISIPGVYTLEGETAASINGEACKPGSTVYLSKGLHTIAPQTASTQMALRWGNNLYKPSYELSSVPTFYGF
jgi:hypothetical protein